MEMDFGDFVAKIENRNERIFDFIAEHKLSSNIETLDYWLGVYALANSVVDKEIAKEEADNEAIEALVKAAEKEESKIEEIKVETITYPPMPEGHGWVKNLSGDSDFYHEDAIIKVVYLNGKSSQGYVKYYNFCLEDDYLGDHRIAYSRLLKAHDGWTINYGETPDCEYIDFVRGDGVLVRGWSVSSCNFKTDLPIDSRIIKWREHKVEDA